MASTINATTSSGIVATADNTGQLALQANGTTVMTVTSTGVTTQVGAPAFSAWASASQTFSSGVFTKIQCNTEEFDTNSNYDTTTYRFTPTVAGYYQLTGAFYINTGSSGGESILSIHKNGSEFKRGIDIGNNTAGSIYQITVAALVYLNGTTDYVEMYGYMSVGHTSGSGQSANYFQGFLARSA